MASKTKERASHIERNPEENHENGDFGALEEFDLVKEMAGMVSTSKLELHNDIRLIRAYNEEFLKGKKVDGSGKWEVN